MALNVPTRTDLSIYRERVDLEGLSFIVDFQFNSREGFWYFDLLDVDEVPIKAGVKVVTGAPLLRLISDARRPPGELLATDQTGEDREAGREDLGGDVLLVYATAEEVAAQAGA